MTARYLLPLLPLFLTLGGCPKECEEGDTCDTSDADTDTDTDTDVDGFDVKGLALNLLTQQPAAEGLCVHAADPTDALSGGELEILASGTVGAAGAYEVTGIVTDSTVGLLMLVQDCAAEGTVMPSATGMSASTYATLEDGGVITDYKIFSLDVAARNTFQSLLGNAGYTGNFGTEGGLLGFVFDSTGMPVGDAVVTGPTGTTTYYFYGKGFNTTGTVAAAGSLFIVPSAPVYSYTCAATGYTFDSLLVGSQPGYAVIVKFVAQ